MEITEGRNLQNYKAEMWFGLKPHPVLKKGWSLVTKSLKNRKKYGWSQFDTAEKVKDFLIQDRRRGMLLARLLVGYECDNILKCNKLFIQPGEASPLIDFVEAMKTQYNSYRSEIENDPLAGGLLESNRLIIENHRKNRKAHQVARDNWWYDA